MMRLHKVYHRLSLLPFSPNPSLLLLTPPLCLRCLRRRTVKFTNISSMATSRFRNIVPLSAMLAEDGGDGGSNGSVSPSTATSTSINYDGRLKCIFLFYTIIYVLDLEYCKVDLIIAFPVTYSI
ncbi:hypothetical protein L6164_034778 [Bauhinia variegata]|uniref:Uncharacterized protein n=1 Tax=Bauhinia variegata TaxID=167791 RepID=A0ACB9KVM1_BAUVA|nr:hypothetical protein L6164_034778 [Bauhinia variegata]